MSPHPETARPLKLGEIRAAGWLYRQIWNDLERGFAGCLDRLVPEIFEGDDIYGSSRLGLESTAKDLGTTNQGDDLVEQQMWWNSETQSNWWDGLIRAAVQVDHPQVLHKVRKYIERVLASQDADGYLGIYAPETRFNFCGENGELWAQACLMRGLLAWHEASGQVAVLQAVERAVALIMEAYGPGGENPFDIEHTICGPEHGLMFTDVVDRLYFLTSEVRYRDFSHSLYESFNLGSTTERDAASDNLLDPNYRLLGHGVHTAEHLRAVANAAYASGDPLLERALEGYLQKLEPCLVPSGALIGDEYIQQREADASTTGYEYCSIHELLDSYCSLLHKSGDPTWAERIEWLLFNAGQGARMGDGRAVAYCTADNVDALMGHLDMDAPDNTPEQRFKYSPAHQDVAVCCAPNACRIYPYYVQNMWQCRGDGLAMNLYGPSLLETEIGGTSVRIAVETQYPFGHHLAFTVSTGAPLEMPLMLRKPTWAESIQVTGAEYEEQAGYLVLSNRWEGERRFKVFFRSQPEVIEYHNGGRLVRYGPLLFALPIAAEVVPGRKYKEGFQDALYRPLGDTGDALVIADGAKFTVRKQIFEENDPWSRAVLLHGEMFDHTTGEPLAVQLVPMGATVLRRVWFGAAPVDSS